MSTFAVTGEMALKGADRGASGVTAMRLSAREASCSVLWSGWDFKMSWTDTGRLRKIS